MEQLIKDLEQIWESYKDHDDHARVDQMISCLNDMIGTAEVIKAKAVKILSEIK
jgi:hypothetical protein